MASVVHDPKSTGTWRTRLLCAVAASVVSLSAWGLTPARLGDFAYYTLALSWHPGFCATEGSKRAECRDQHAYPLLVFHGLWPSLPASLAHQGIKRRQWWHEGCFHFKAPPTGGFCAESPPLDLSPALAEALTKHMPGSASCLERHEYAKHAACFGFAAEDYFRTGLMLRDKLVNSAFGDYVRNHAGSAVERNEVIEVFEHTFGTRMGRALKLVCERDGSRSLLTEVQVGIRATALDAFPASASLARLDTGHCATRLWLDAPG